MAIRDGVPSTSSQTLAPSVPKWFLASSFTSQSAFETLTFLMSPRSNDGPPVMQCPEDESPVYSGDFAGAFDLVRTSVANAWTLDQLSDLGSVDLQASESSSLSGQESYLAVSMLLQTILVPKMLKLVAPSAISCSTAAYTFILVPRFCTGSVPTSRNPARDGITDSASHCRDCTKFIRYSLTGDV